MHKVFSVVFCLLAILFFTRTGFGAEAGTFTNVLQRLEEQNAQDGVSRGKIPAAHQTVGDLQQFLQALAGPDNSDSAYNTLVDIVSGYYLSKIYDVGNLLVAVVLAVPEHDPRFCRSYENYLASSLEYNCLFMARSLIIDRIFEQSWEIDSDERLVSSSVANALYGNRLEVVYDKFFLQTNKINVYVMAANKAKAHKVLTGILPDRADVAHNPSAAKLRSAFIDAVCKYVADEMQAAGRQLTRSKTAFSQKDRERALDLVRKTLAKFGRELTAAHASRLQHQCLNLGDTASAQVCQQILTKR